jgi:hypothetical protein
METRRRSQRNYADFFHWPHKETKEAGVMDQFLEVRRSQGLPDYAAVVQCTHDPPDFAAVDDLGQNIAIELTELVAADVIEHNLAAAPDRRVWRKWTEQEVIDAIGDLLRRKGIASLNGGPYAEYHVLIYTDEPLISPAHYVPLLERTAIASPAQVSSAFLMSSYDPGTQSYPMATLRLRREHGNAASA